MTEQKHWFARRFPVGHKSNAMMPVSPEGWWVFVVFIAATVAGFFGLLFLGMNGQLVSGVAMFVLLTLAGGGMFFSMASSRGDKVNTVEHYRQGRPSSSK